MRRLPTNGPLFTSAELLAIASDLEDEALQLHKTYGSEILPLSDLLMDNAARIRSTFGTKALDQKALAC